MIEVIQLRLVPESSYEYSIHHTSDTVYIAKDKFMRGFIVKETKYSDGKLSHNEIIFSTKDKIKVRDSIEVIMKMINE